MPIAESVISATPAARTEPDLGLSHIALTVRDVDRSIDFYRIFAGFDVVHRRGAPGRRVVWLSDLRRPFAVVLIEAENPQGLLEGISHLGIGCESREEVDRLAAVARAAGLLKLEPRDSGQPVGYWALLRDPDGHNLELAYGQEVASEIARASAKAS